ncbi:MAG TPA: 2OG-Fe(II) oxygenase [Methylophilaceae bacterium]
MIEDFLPATTVAKLAQETRRLELRRAGVGKPRLINNEIRGDHILWLESPQVTKLQQACLDRFEQLRLILNRDMKLGLFEFESHIAHYPVGAFYRKHLDSFQQENRRVISCILYLNQSWKAEHGGQLRLYLNNQDYTDISPQGGTLVVFFSDQFWHEVLPAKRDRLSIAGWFKNRD